MTIQSTRHEEALDVVRAVYVANRVHNSPNPNVAREELSRAVDKAVQLAIDLQRDLERLEGND